MHTTVFNPKCVSMGELYGEFNELTQEWKDGLASSFIRQAVVDTPSRPSSDGRSSTAPSTRCGSRT